MEEEEECSIVMFWFRLFLNSSPRSTFSFLGTQPHFENAHLLQSPRFTERKQGQTPGLLGKKQRRLLSEVTKQKDFLNPFLQCCKGQQEKGENRD